MKTYLFRIGGQKLYLLETLANNIKEAKYKARKKLSKVYNYNFPENYPFSLIYKGKTNDKNIENIIV